MKLACFLKGNTFLCYGIENATDRWKLERAFLQPLSGKNVPVFLKKKSNFSSSSCKKNKTYYSCFTEPQRYFYFISSVTVSTTVKEFRNNLNSMIQFSKIFIL